MVSVGCCVAGLETKDRSKPDKDTEVRRVQQYQQQLVEALPQHRGKIICCDEPKKQKTVDLPSPPGWERHRGHKCGRRGKRHRPEPGLRGDELPNLDRQRPELVAVGLDPVS